MALNVKKILAMAGGIAATVSTGGLAAPVLIPAALNLASELIPEEDAKKIATKADLDNWERVMIVQWVETYRRLLSRGIGNLEQAFRGKLFSDFVMNYADHPRDEWVESVYEMVSEAVRWQIATATTIPEGG